MIREGSGQTEFIHYQLGDHLKMCKALQVEYTLNFSGTHTRTSKTQPTIKYLTTFRLI